MTIPSVQESHELEVPLTLCCGSADCRTPLEATNLWYHVEEEVKPPIDPNDLAEYNKIVVNAK
jgi:hypothetical protein